MMAPKILLVDDDKSLLRVLAAILNRQGYSVDAVESGKEALKNIETTRYHLALLDVRLQDMNGLDLRKMIKARAKGTPVITFTGLPSDADEALALSYGAEAYLEKPIKPEILLDVIRGNIRKAEMPQ